MPAAPESRLPGEADRKPRRQTASQASGLRRVGLATPVGGPRARRRAGEPRASREDRERPG